MADLANEWGSDLSLSATGDLLLVTGPVASRERVLRRLLTNPGDDIWDLGYGAGLPRQIGETTLSATIEANVRRQLFEEQGVSQDPPPTVSVSPILGGMAVHVTYYDDVTGEPVALGFSVER